jgi:riboflavin synthase
VDAVGRVTGREPLPDGSTLVVVGAPAALLRYVVPKGSVCVDGVSLTVTTVTGDAANGADGTFGVALIPHTLAITTFGTRRVGDAVNLEVDVLAKYVERLLQPADNVLEG